MTNEELVGMIQAGDREKMGELWANCEKFTRWIADRWPLSATVDREDYYQAGFLALNKAVEVYDPDRGTRFLTVLTMTLNGAFEEAQGRRSRKEKKDPIHTAYSLEYPLADKNGNPYTVEDTVADPAADISFEDAERRLWVEELHTALEDALEGLPGDQGDTLRRIYYQGQKLSQIAQDTGSRLEEVRTRERKGLKALRSTHLSRPLLQFVEERTPYYVRVGVNGYAKTGLSAVEVCAIRREELIQRYAGTSAGT